MREHPIEARTDHRCILGALTRGLADARAEDSAALAARALERMLDAGEFDQCCVPAYLALAPDQNAREVQIPVAREGDVETRVIVWPVGSRDLDHPHTNGWTTFVPVRGSLATVEQAAGEPAAACELATRHPLVLRPEDGIRHRVRNVGDEPALSVHISGTS